MNIKRILFLLALSVLSAVLGGCALTFARRADSPGTLEAREHLQTKNPALYSSYIPGRGWSFILMPDEFLPASPENYIDLYQIEELPAAFRSLKKGSVVVWRNDGLDNWAYPADGWTYPRSGGRIEKQVRRAAEAAGVQLEILPCVS